MVMTFFIKVTERDMLIDMVGAVIFIAMLLVMSGVEQNPGPHDVFNFRYQYLLIEVGTKVIRKAFDNIVGRDLNLYFNHHPAQYAQLQLLILRNKLTPDQQNLLPPIEKSPSSENFDITLLCLLLRNICGLCPPGDKVWIQPATTDTSLEACITRLRLCRNSVAHSESVLKHQTELHTMWAGLVDILNELSKVCRFTDLPTLIKEAETIEIDERLKERLESVLELWDEMEKKFEYGLGEIIRSQGAISKDQGLLIKGQEVISEGLGEIREGLKEMIKGQCERGKCQGQIIEELGDIKKDIRLKLIDIYQHELDNFELCPLVKYECGQILNFYQLPLMQAVDYHKVEKYQTEQSFARHTEVKTCNDLFCNGDKHYKNIYLTGYAGIGKTSFSRFLAFLWSSSMLDNSLENSKFQAYADYLARFEFVFYVNLRDADDLNVISMIVKQLSPYLSDDKQCRLYEVIEQILNNHESLVIMDGLDEWTPKLVNKRKFNLPIRPKSLPCVYFTTCRPYKIENVRLSRADIDRQIKMVGFNEIAINAYVTALIKYINSNYNENKTSNDFMKAVKCVGINNLLHIPIITSHLVILWIDRPLISMSRCLIYGNIIDMLFKIAFSKETDIPPQTSSNLNLPDALSELHYLEDKFSNVEKLCLLSYRLLFELDMNIASLVFTREQLASKPYCLSESETNFLCTIGILSKSQVFVKYGKLDFKLSFLHKSYIEFFAAVYVSTLEAREVLDLVNTFKTINDALKFENFLIFFSGLMSESMNSLICRIYSLITVDLISSRTKSFLDEVGHSLLMEQYMNMILTCYAEGSCRMESPIYLEDFIFYDKFLPVSNNAHAYGEEYNTHKYKPQLLRKLLRLNGTNVKYLNSRPGEYIDEFDKITNLQWLSIGLSPSVIYNVKFNELMLRNKSSLHSIRIAGDWIKRTLTPELPLNSLPYLTSLSLYSLTMSHQYLHSTLKFLSTNIHLKHIVFYHVKCYEHQNNTDKCALPCDFSGCNHLETLKLDHTNISFSEINVSSLEKVELHPIFRSIADYQSNIFHCTSSLNASKLTSLDIHGTDALNVHTVKHLISFIQFLPTIRDIRLNDIDIPDAVHLTLNPHVTQVDIYLECVTMSDSSLKSFIESCTNKYSHNTVRMNDCIIKHTDEGNVSLMSEEDSVNFMYNCLTSISTVTILDKDSWSLSFETKACQ
ncbi:hypothetical protein ACF0H5_021477 [Mactra antiquata]